MGAHIHLQVLLNKPPLSMLLTKTGFRAGGWREPPSVMEARRRGVANTEKKKKKKPKAQPGHSLLQNKSLNKLGGGQQILSPSGHTKTRRPEDPHGLVEGKKEKICPTPPRGMGRVTEKAHLQHSVIGTGHSF